MPTFAEAAVTVIEQKRAALEVLDAARSLADGNPLVFPNRWGNRIRDTFVSQLLKDLYIAAVPHGFRSSFRDWASEETDHPREVVEAALAHAVRNRVEAAYARSDLFARRRRLMDEWAAYLDGDHGSDHDARHSTLPPVRRPAAAGRLPTRRSSTDFAAPAWDWDNAPLSQPESHHAGRAAGPERPAVTEPIASHGRRGRPGIAPPVVPGATRRKPAVLRRNGLARLAGDLRGLARWQRRRDPPRVALRQACELRPDVGPRPDVGKTGSRVGLIGD